MNQQYPVQKLAYSIEAFCELVGLGRTSVFAELKSGRLKKVKVGHRTLIPASEALAWLERLAGGPALASAKA